MSQGTNLDLILSTDYLSTEDQKILQEDLFLILDNVTIIMT